MNKQLVKALYKASYEILKKNNDLDTLKTLQTCCRKNMNIKNPKLIEFHTQDLFDRMLLYIKHNRFNTINKNIKI